MIMNHDYADGYITTLRMRWKDAVISPVARREQQNQIDDWHEAVPLYAGMVLIPPHIERGYGTLFHVICTAWKISI